MTRRSLWKSAIFSGEALTNTTEGSAVSTMSSFVTDGGSFFSRSSAFR